MDPLDEKGWIVCESEAGHVACYFERNGDQDFKRASCGGVAKRVRRWVLAQDIGVVPLCENCKMMARRKGKKKR